MLVLRHYIHLYFFLDTTYFGVVSGVFLVLDVGFVVLKFYILVFPVFICIFKVQEPIAVICKTDIRKNAFFSKTSRLEPS
jgi:hypothetical protein